MNTASPALTAQLKNLSNYIQTISSVLLTTHKSCDGDGLGSITALYYGLKQLNKKVRIVTVDAVPEKYHFFIPKDNMSFNELKSPLQPGSLALICDTNDFRLIEPLYTELKNTSKKIIFMDHHCLLSSSPRCTSADYIVQEKAASTGEIIYFLLKELKIKMNTDIAVALYISILSDTQNFQFIKESSNSYKICSELFSYIKNSSFIYHQLFSMNKEKLHLLAAAIHKAEYFNNEEIALLEINKNQLTDKGLEVPDACDFIEMILKVPSVKIAVLIVTLAENQYKLSFRSKSIDVSRLAEQFSGGGHFHAAGATLTNYKKNIKQEVLQKSLAVLAG